MIKVFFIISFLVIFVLVAAGIVSLFNDKSPAEVLEYWVKPLVSYKLKRKADTDKDKSKP